MRGIIVKLPPWVSAEIEAVSAITGCGKNHLARMIRSRVNEFVVSEFKNQILEVYRQHLPQRSLDLPPANEEESFV